MQQLLTFSASRTAITNTVTRAAIGEQMSADSLYNLMGSLSPDRAAKLVKRGQAKIWGWFSVVTNTASTLVGLVMILKIFGYVLSSAVNMLTIGRARGCSPYIIAGLWTAATNFILSRPRPKPEHDPENPSAPPPYERSRLYPDAP